MKAILLGNAIRDLCRNWGIDKKLKEHKVIAQWLSIVGERIAREAQPVSVRDGKLFVHVEKAVWRNELTFMKRELISKVNRNIGVPLIHDIVFCSKKGDRSER
jgi:predicted nucleic acid-binding Zn ribbon protein